MIRERSARMSFSKVVSGRVGGYHANPGRNTYPGICAPYVPVRWVRWFWNEIPNHTRLFDMILWGRHEIPYVRYAPVCSILWVWLFNTLPNIPHPTQHTLAVFRRRRRIYQCVWLLSCSCVSQCFFFFFFLTKGRECCPLPRDKIPKKGTRYSVRLILSRVKLR